MPIVKCSVPNCGSEIPKFVLHTFPLNCDRRKIWLSKVNNPSLSSLNTKQIVQRRLCHLHFEEKFTLPDRKLTRNAYLTLFSSEEISSRIPENGEDNDASGSNLDNNYGDAHSGDPEYGRTETSLCQSHQLNSPVAVTADYTNRKVSAPVLEDHKYTTPIFEDLDNLKYTTPVIDKDHENTTPVLKDHNYTAPVVDKDDENTTPAAPELEGTTWSGEEIEMKPFNDSNLEQSQNETENNDIALVLITVPEKEIGSKIGRALIEHDLAACVDVISETKSIYKCQGKVLLLAKTRSCKVTELCEYAAEKYPIAGYQIVSVQVNNGNPHYLKWIADNVPSH